MTEDDVDGWGRDSLDGGPGEAGNMFFKAGLTLFFIHVATLELWLLTLSAAIFTVSKISPRKKKNSIQDSMLKKLKSE